VTIKIIVTANRASRATVVVHEAQLVVTMVTIKMHRHHHRHREFMMQIRGLGFMMTMVTIPPTFRAKMASEVI
jgi:putative heme degradation protein